jgi:hypothetical protein
LVARRPVPIWHGGGAVAQPAQALQLQPTSTAAPSKPAGGNMFAELSKGGDITAGLKKVTRDMTNKDKKTTF